jgi:hypothetical protein
MIAEQKWFPQFTRSLHIQNLGSLRAPGFFGQTG